MSAVRFATAAALAAALLAVAPAGADSGERAEASPRGVIEIAQAVAQELEPGDSPDVLDEGGGEAKPAPPTQDLGPRYRPPPAKAARSRSVPRRRSLYTESPRDRYLLDGRWRFRPDPDDIGLLEHWERYRSLDGGWQHVSVPYAFNAGVESDGSMIGAVGWYRRDFRLPSSRERLAWLIRFESVNYRARVWLNGKLLGSSAVAGLPFVLRAKDLKRNGVNRLVVRVNSQRGRTDLPPFRFGVDGRPIGGWWNYGGILREVYLERVDRVAIESVRVNPVLPCASCPAIANLLVKLRNHSPQRQAVELSGRFGGQPLNVKRASIGAGGSNSIRTRLRIANPRLWSPDSPSLYTVKLKLRAERKVPRRGRRARRTLDKVAAYTLRTGIRSIRVDGQGILRLNGKPLVIRGVGLHEDHPIAGAALTQGNRSRMIAEVADSGANLVRSHYPLHPHFHELADRKGIMVWSEIPMYAAKSSQVKKRAMRHRALRSLRRNVEANVNHPSVVVWSIGNELPSIPKAAEAWYYRASVNLAHRLDPSRPVGLAITGYPNVSFRSAYAPIEVIGINDYFGWYRGPDGSLTDREGLGPYLDRMRRDYPAKALLVSEFGAEANRDGPVEEKGTYEFQREFVAYHLDRIAERRWLAGAVYWTLGEFRVRPGWDGGNPQPGPNTALHQKGLLDYNRLMVKPAYRELQRRYRATPTLRP